MTQVYNNEILKASSSTTNMQQRKTSYIQYNKINYCGYDLSAILMCESVKEKK